MQSVSPTKATEFKPKRRHAQLGGLSKPETPALKPVPRQAQRSGRLGHGGWWSERRRAVVAGQTRWFSGAGEVVCGRFSRRSDDPEELPPSCRDDGFWRPMIVPAPNGARCLEVPADAPLWQEFRSAVSTERLNRPSANRKRPRSISRGFQSIRGAILGSVGAAESSTRHRHACGPVGGQPARAPLVREPPWLGHVLDAADLSAPRRMRVAV